MQEQEKVYLSRFNKVWQKIGTDTPLTDKLTLKPGEKLTDYKQVPKPKAPPRVVKTEKPWSPKNNDKKGDSEE